MLLQYLTPLAWTDIALSDLNAVLQDHAHCEKKAAAAAMSFAANYPHRSALVQACIKLAQEELRHFGQVHQILLEREQILGRDVGDPYVQMLHKLCRKETDPRFIDRLLIAALVEARSCERLQMLADGLKASNEKLAKFYHSLAKAEAAHQRLYIDLACQYMGEAAVLPRLEDLAHNEAQIVQDMPLLPRIH